jgi:monoamine oxidase
MAKQILKTDILVIGAGYAGIGAASKLYGAGKDFLVLEARDRIGGRVNTHQLESSGATVELGAQWIGPTQQLMWDLVKKHGVETFDTYDSGKNILHLNGRTSAYKGLIPKMDPISLLDMGIALERLNKLCKKVPLESPWLAPEAERWDSMTMATWIDRNVKTSKARKMMHVGIETVFACMASEISFLHAMFYSHSGGNLESLLAIPKGAQQTLFKKGTQQLLALEAEPFKEKLLLNQPLYAVEQSDSGVVAHTASVEVHAQKLIMTLPPALCQRISFMQPLPQRKAQLFQRVPMGAAMKCYAVYEQPFWRDLGFSGQIVSDRAPLKVSFDCTKPGGPGLLLFFVEGSYARDFIELSLEERRRIVTEELVFHFGAKAMDMIDYTDKCWTEEEFSGGCYAGNFPTGVWTQFGRELRKITGHIHWAGTETAMNWSGYMDGALESGYRAAEEVIQFY